MAERIRVGVLGAGAMGLEHASVYAEMPDVEVVGVFSRDIGRAREATAASGAQAFDDPAALIEDASLDAIDVCVPSTVHADFVVPALQHGKHVFCETPLALSLHDALRMREAARASGKLLQVGLLMRSTAPYQHIKTVADSGAHGRLLSLTTYRLGSYLRPGAPDHKPHYSDPSTELMTFDFDFALWLMGSPAQLSASAAGASSGEISALLSYPDGRQAAVLASGLMPKGYPFSVGFRALFEDAVFELANVFADGGPPQSRFTVADDSSGPRDVPIIGHNPYAMELQRFVDCMQRRATPDLLDADRAIEALKLSLATQQALAQSQVIPIES